MMTRGVHVTNRLRQVTTKIRRNLGLHALPARPARGLHRDRT